MELCLGRSLALALVLAPACVGLNPEFVDSTGASDASSTTTAPQTTGGPTTAGPGTSGTDATDPSETDTTTGVTSTTGSTGSTGSTDATDATDPSDSDPGICGDGVVDPGEECDDGNDDNSDTCLEGCVPASCGDGFLGPGESCDDGNQMGGDGCEPDCSLASCGDAMVDPGEECDDGNEINKDECLNTCVLASCGDGFLAPNEGCDDGNANNADACTELCAPASCGDGYLQPDFGEECDDGNELENDGCELNCQLSGVAELALGLDHSCARMASGDVLCWGSNSHGQLGQAILDPTPIGDDETPEILEPIDLGAKALQLSAGAAFTCARIPGGKVRCWGSGADGRLGYGNPDNIGDDEHPFEAGDVEVGGGPVQKISSGLSHTCALLEGGAVRCWGQGAFGKLGHASLDTIGLEAPPKEAGDVPIGDLPAIDIAAGGDHSCALLEGGYVLCWGRNTFGQLGQGHTEHIGDDEIAGAQPPLVFQAPVVAIVSGGEHSCAIDLMGKVSCWGHNDVGQLGYGITLNIGESTKADGNPVPLGLDDVEGVDLALGHKHTCALLNTDDVRCWGLNNNGQLGVIDHPTPVGDDEAVLSVPAVAVGETATQLAAGHAHTCARTGSSGARCWGINGKGELGYGHTMTIGDNEHPFTAGDVPLP